MSGKVVWQLLAIARDIGGDITGVDRYGNTIVHSVHNVCNCSKYSEIAERRIEQWMDI